MDLSTDEDVFKAVGKSWRRAMLIKVLRAEGARTARQLSERLTPLVEADKRRTKCDRYFSVDYQPIINDLGFMWALQERGEEGYADLDLRRRLTTREDHATDAPPGSYLWSCGNGKRWLMPHAGNVLALRLEGLSNREIAERLNLNYARVSELANDPFGDRARERNRRHEQNRRVAAMKPDKDVLAFIASLEAEGYSVRWSVEENDRGTLMRIVEVEYGGHSTGGQAANEDWWTILEFVGLSRE